MKALVTGASSGIGRDISRELAKLGYDLVLVARNAEKLETLKNELDNKKINIEIIQMDLTNRSNCINLHKQFENQISLLVNNAGFGTFGEFDNISLDKELQLIDTNITAVQILTKLFLQDMKRKNDGHILNVASIAGFMPGPLMSTYYSSKAYIVRLSQSIKEELRRANSNVKISILCPGPVETNFNNIANVKFSAKPLSSEYVAKYTVKKIHQNKFCIIPGKSIKVLRYVAKIIPDNIMARFAYGMQKRKNKK